MWGQGASGRPVLPVAGGLLQTVHLRNVVVSVSYAFLFHFSYSLRGERGRYGVRLYGCILQLSLGCRIVLQKVCTCLHTRTCLLRVPVRTVQLKQKADKNL